MDNKLDEIFRRQYCVGLSFLLQIVRSRNEIYDFFSSKLSRIIIFSPLDQNRIVVTRALALLIPRIRKLFLRSAIRPAKQNNIIPSNINTIWSGGVCLLIGF